MHMIWKTVLTGHIPHKFKNKGAILQVEEVSDLSYELCYCLDILVIQIKTKPVHLVKWLFSWEFQMTGRFHEQKYLKPTCVYCMGWIQVQF